MFEREVEVLGLQSQIVVTQLLQLVVRFLQLVLLESMFSKLTEG